VGGTVLGVNRPRRHSSGPDASDLGDLPPLLVAVADRLVGAYRSVVAGGSTNVAPAGVPAGLAARTEEAYQAGRNYRPDPRPGSAPAVNACSELDRLAEEAMAYHDPLLDRFGQHLLALAEWNRALVDGSGQTITSASLAAHGPLQEGTVRHAEDILRDVPEDASEGLMDTRVAKAFDSNAAVQLFTHLLDVTGADGWRAVVEPSLRSRVAVRPTSRTLVVRSTASFDAIELRRLAVHEIGTHVRRAVTGAYQPLSLYSVAAGPGALAVEEGLAVWSEEQSGLLDSRTLRRYAGRVLAVRDGLNLPYGEVYANARAHFGPREAFDLACRVKRGLADWNEPGAYVKDKAYLEGWAQVGPAASDPLHRRMLWSGKISDLGADTQETLIGLRVAASDPLEDHRQIVGAVDNWLTRQL
jgi:hypothetical protein